MLAFMICRDRVSYARRCSTALLRAGLDVVIVDHGSTYGPMVRWLGWAERYASSPTSVVRMPNQHPRDLWAQGGVIGGYVRPGERFVVTDCDVVPDPDCPPDWLAHLGMLLDLQPLDRKAGLGLRTDDLPVHFADRDRVIAWERQFQHVDDGGQTHASTNLGTAVPASIDTTLALYRRYEPFALGPAQRTRAPYRALHLPWYEDAANPIPEQVFYREHAAFGHWRNPEGFTDTHGLGGNA